mgnify:CR=1 FL=1
MKTLEQIKEEVAIELYNAPWSSIIPYDIDEEIVNKIAKYYAYECAKEALRLASESAEFIAEHQFYEETIKDSVDNVGSHLVFIDKQSILSESNLPKH